MFYKAGVRVWAIKGFGFTAWVLFYTEQGCSIGDPGSWVYGLGFTGQGAKYFGDQRIRVDSSAHCSVCIVPTIFVFA